MLWKVKLKTEITNYFIEYNFFSVHKCLNFCLHKPQFFNCARGLLRFFVRIGVTSTWCTGGGCNDAVRYRRRRSSSSPLERLDTSQDDASRRRAGEHWAGPARSPLDPLRASGISSPSPPPDSLHQYRFKIKFVPNKLNSYRNCSWRQW